MLSQKSTIFTKHRKVSRRGNAVHKANRPKCYLVSCLIGTHSGRTSSRHISAASKLSGPESTKAQWHQGNKWSDNTILFIF